MNYFKQSSNHLMFGFILTVALTGILFWLATLRNEWLVVSWVWLFWLNKFLEWFSSPFLDSLPCKFSINDWSFLNEVYPEDKSSPVFILETWGILRSALLEALKSCCLTVVFLRATCCLVSEPLPSLSFLGVFDPFKTLCYWLTVDYWFVGDLCPISPECTRWWVILRGALP